MNRSWHIYILDIFYKLNTVIIPNIKINIFLIYLNIIIIINKNLIICNGRKRRCRFEKL